MSESKYSHIFYCNRGMSLSEYKEILDLIQSNHPFPSMPKGANVKYVDSDLNISNILDTRDGGMFNFSIQLRGFATVLFTEKGFDLGPAEGSTLTGKNMYESVLDYLKTQGSVEHNPFSSKDIGKLRGMKAVFGTYCGRLVNEDMIAEFPFASHLLGEMWMNMFVITSSDPGEGEDKVTGFIMINDITNDVSLYNKEKNLVFSGKLFSVSDLMHVLRLTEIPQSF